MKNPFNLLLLFIGITLLISCGSSDDDIQFDPNLGGDLGLGSEVDDCLDLGPNELVLSIQDEFTTLPGKVSVFFRVSDEFGNPVAGLTADQFTIYEQGQNDDCFRTISPSPFLFNISYVGEERFLSTSAIMSSASISISRFQVRLSKVLFL